MRILFLSDNFPPESNAPATRVYEHAVRWVRDGHHVTVITGAPNFPEGKVYPGYVNRWRQVETRDGIRVVRVKTFITANEGLIKRSLDYLSFMVTGFIGGLREPRPDVVVATSPQFFCAMAGWALSVARWRPFVFELRDLWPASIVAVGAMAKSPVIRWLECIELFLYRRARRIVTVTHSFRADLVARGIPGDKIRVVLNGVDQEAYRPAPRDAELASRYGFNGCFVVGYMGTHGMAHGLDRVLEAASALKHRDDIRFFFAGAGAERDRVAHQVEALQLTNVTMIPRQPKSAMPALWSLCDLALIPLRDSPVFATVIPSKLFEAMGMGVPVLMSLPEGEATAIVRSAGCGVCVPPGDASRMAEAIEQLADDPARHRTMAAASAASAAHYSRDRLAKVMLDVLVDLAPLSSQPRRSGRVAVSARSEDP
ncbi:glycosyltransferase family 4 protein [Tahibacter amnicola]|uniref:Glycosyltransferase family 4 protein n=1 Tax=Tahibacter amnicola TaxID=2976241 RepID=A0ABY6B8H3_9GAMM|nr:glycosyltransferase family 4 protein [Tahibacter amnicola]UXI66381.1 glycosyltransferase family 4 protein [Tahibacter amnicola]